MTTKNKHRQSVLLLQRLGFTEYEAQAYVTLVGHGELSGYELAKHSGIPRANIYAVIGKLADRGAVWQAQDEKGQRYAAVPPTTLLRGIEADRKRVLEAADQAFASLEHAEAPASVFNLHGEQLLDRARQLIDACTEHLLIAIQPSEAKVLAPALQQARERGVEIVTLCLEACDPPCGGCMGKVHRHALAPGDGSRWLLLVTDRNQTLVGRFSSTVREGLVTAQPLVIELARAYVHQSLALSTLGDELAGRFDGLLSERARRLLYPETAAPADR